jgi:hypothetical protein
MEFRIFSEHWVRDREIFMFRCSTASASWTFYVDQQTLEELDDDAYFDRAGVFDAFRPSIYRVARTRVAAGDPAGQHAITAKQIREARWLMHPGALQSGDREAGAAQALQRLADQ